MKKLKKVWILTLMAAGFAMVLGCSNSSSSEEQNDPVDGDKVITVFDPEDYTGDEGEKVVRDGVTYLKITVDEWDIVINVNPINLVGKTKFKCTMYGEEPNADYIYKIKLADSAYDDISNIEMNGIVTTPTEREAGVAEKTEWNKVSETFLCDRIQPVVLDSSIEGYPAQSGVVVYIGKITAE
ncbi:MAG: hypothetical protein J1E07_09325 [Treponema sp.]|nr:hypothetical protein [Treponema sp.]